MILIIELLRVSSTDVSFNENYKAAKENNEFEKYKENFKSKMVTSTNDNC